MPIVNEFAEKARMIQVSIPASVPLKEFDYNIEMEIINPVADVDWYIKAEDIVLKGKHSSPISTQPNINLLKK